MTISESAARRISKWLIARGSERLRAYVVEMSDSSLAGAAANCGWTSLDGDPIWPLAGSHSGSSSAIVPVSFDTWTSESGIAIGRGVLRLEYVRVDGEWHLDSIPSRRDLEPEIGIALPSAVHGERMPMRPETSPILYIYSFPPGEVPSFIRDTYDNWYEDWGVLIPEDQQWEDVWWKGRPMIYPGIDSQGRTDPLAPAQPDTGWLLEATAVDLWLPYLDWDDSANGAPSLPSNPITLRTDRNASVGLVSQVLRVMARPSVQIRRVRIEVLAQEDDPASSILHLTQPLPSEVLENVLRVAAGTASRDLEGIVGSASASRVGIRASEGQSWQDVVDTLDQLTALGVPSVYLEVLP